LLYKCATPAWNCDIIFIPVTRRVKGYTRFVGKCVTGRRKRFQPHKVCIFLIRTTSRVNLAMSVCTSVRLSVWKLRSYRFLRSLRSACLFQHSATPTLTPTNRGSTNCGSYSLDARLKILTEIYCSRQYLSIDPKKKLPRPL